MSDVAFSLRLGRSKLPPKSKLEFKPPEAKFDLGGMGGGFSALGLSSWGLLLMFISVWWVRRSNSS